MKDKELKALLKDAYQITPSEEEKHFIRRYEQRAVKLTDIIGLEMRYMKAGAAVSALFLILVFVLITRSKNPDFIWFVSGMLPVAALILMSGLGKSERCGMQELEAACRFSLKFVTAIRMLIIGTVSLFILGVCTLLLQHKVGFGLPTILGFLGTPYMINVWGNLLITRKWHAKENMIGCVAFTALTCMLPILFEKAVYAGIMAPSLIICVLGLGMILTIRECMMFVRESEELSWNYC